MARRRREPSIETLSQWQLVRRRFARHRLAVTALFVLIALYTMALFAEFFAPQSPVRKDLDFAYSPSHAVRFRFDRGLYAPALRQVVDPVTLRKSYLRETDAWLPLGFFVRGSAYRLWGLFPADRHFFGVDRTRLPAGRTPTGVYLLGADKYGRDLLSRLIYGARISLSVGLIGIAVTFLLGMTIGGISGYVSGRTDTFIQRAIEIINSFPRLPMWLALGAAMPADWSPLKTYFAITVALSLLSWTRLARIVRGKILSLREEDYAMAARLLGARHGRILFRHLLPGFTSHIIVALTLNIPGMILGETSLSFLGLGLRPPVVSWGVMLQDCMDVKAVRYYPWLLAPVVLIVLTVMSFNFLGDGLRDAADPYASHAALPRRRRRRRGAAPIPPATPALPADAGRDAEGTATESPRDEVLRVEGLETCFYTEAGALRAVDGVSFEVERGRTLALVGESGCGKSVTSYSILRLVQEPGVIAAGHIGVRARDGRTIDVASLNRRSPELYHVRGGLVSMIFQEPMTALSPVHTIGNQIVEAVLLHQDVSRAQAETLAAEMLGKVGIPGAAQRLRQYPHELSGGMRQRVVIAMALVCRPLLLIADEPTTALDVTIQAQILRLIRDLQAETGTSVLFITHDLAVVAQMADEVAVMYLGRIVERGTVREVVKAPLHPYTRGLLASLPDLSGKRRRLRSIRGSVPGLGHIPPGCPFHPRCDYFVPGLCDAGGPPPLETIRDGRRAACLRAQELLADEPAARTAGLRQGDASIASPTPTVPRPPETPNPAPLLRVRGLTKHFPVHSKGFTSRVVGHVKAVTDISFDLLRGETLGLVGESGCGKTTTGRTILRALTPTAGEILFDEGEGPVDLARLGERELRGYRTRMQMIFQDPFGSLNPRMTIGDIVGEPLVIHGLARGSELQDRVADMLHRVNLNPDHAIRYPHAFSGGQRQRAGIARALIMRPRLVIADEAVSALDVSVQAQIINLLEDLQEEFRLTYIFVAHDLSVVRHLCDRVAVMYAGRIVELAETDTLFAAPHHPYSRALLSAVPQADPGRPMNFDLHGDVADPSALPAGCTFHPRCPFATERCRAERPELRLLPGGVLARCHFAEELNPPGA